MTIVQQQNNSTVRAEMSSWLETFDWDLFTNYTFKEHFSFNSAKRAIERHYKRTKNSLGVEYPFFYIIEPHSHYATSGTHIHGLVGEVGNIMYSGKKLKKDWRSHKGHGAFKFDKYLQDKGASHYLTKYLVKSNYDSSYWDIFIPEQSAGNEKSIFSN